MTDNFPAFGTAIRKHFEKLAKGKLYVVATDRDEIWQRYLDAYPEGTNPIFRKRPVHDCSCCKSFIRSTGNLVAIKDGAVVTLWDVTGLEHPFNIVAEKMAEYVRSCIVSDVFLTPFKKHGTAENYELIEGRSHKWTHFAVDVPAPFVTQDFARKRGEIRTSKEVLLRGLRELTPAAVTQVIELIKENALYRGQEFLASVKEFQKLQKQFIGINDPTSQELLAWELAQERYARFKNSVIGTLISDISEGYDLEDCVKSFEAKVAPENYKRPTALITKGMVEQATKTIAELGLEEALERRHARFEDVSVNSVLFVDNAVQGKLKGGLKDLLMQEVKPAPFDLKRAEEISVSNFISKLPAFTSLQVYLENSHQGNFMSLTAPVHPDTKSLFKWKNNFAWSYDGNVTDSIKERVKKAGGRVENVAMRVSLAWFNFDDLDLHVEGPDGHIHFRDKAPRGKDGGGYLDVDMNISPTTREAVENIRWTYQPQDGVYSVYVNQFSRREAVDVGFEVEIEHARGVETFKYEKGMSYRENVPVAQITVKKGAIEIRPMSGITSGRRSFEKWGLKTLDLVRVNSLILSPNYWDDQEIGNKHWFFILEGCKNPEPVRGIYNEFLNSALEKHRKVFEVLGDKTKCPYADEQLSGLGFSSTRQDKLTVLATGPGVNRVYTINFG